MSSNAFEEINPVGEIKLRLPIVGQNSERLAIADLRIWSLDNPMLCLEIAQTISQAMAGLQASIDVRSIPTSSCSS